MRKNRAKVFEKISSLIEHINLEVLGYLGIKLETRQEYAIEYPVADAGYGSYNNYLYCEEQGMGKYMKFTMFEKETKNEKYHTNPYRAVNFRRDAEGNLICPNDKKFIFKYNKHVRINRELTSFHEEVISNLECIHSALLCMNRSIQSEGTFGIIKWDKNYKRLLRRGKKSVLLELTLISCGYNLYKYHNKKRRMAGVAT